jgi:hypothetical protein
MCIDIDIDIDIDIVVVVFVDDYVDDDDIIYRLFCAFI